MLKLFSRSTFTSASTLFGQNLNYQSKFLYRRRHQTQPLIRMRDLRPIEPPGNNLQLPDWTPETFLLKIGYGCSEYADKFETLEEVFTLGRDEMKEKGVPPSQRKQIFRMKEFLKRGIVTFEYLGRRTVYTLPATKAKKK